MNIDFKESNWYRVRIRDGKEKETIEFCKNNIVEYPSNIVEAELGDYDNIISDTTEQLTLLDNDGERTVTLLDDSGEEIWSNKDVNTKSRVDLMELITQQDTIIDEIIKGFDLGESPYKLIDRLKEIQEARQGRINWR